MRIVRAPNFFLLAFVMMRGLTAFGSGTDAATNRLVARVKGALAERGTDRRLEALSRLATGLGLDEIPEALKTADGINSFRERLVFKISTLKRWGELAPADAFAYVAQQPECLPKVEVIRTIAPIYGCTNSAAAAAAALKMPPGRARTEAISLIAEAWARKDAKQALQWANELQEEPLRKVALRSIYFVWVHTDPAGASGVVRDLPASDIKNALVINVAQNLAVTNPQAALKWAEALPVESQKDLAIVIATETWADNDPRAAFEFATNLTALELQKRAVRVVLEQWAMQNPQEAFKQATKLVNQDTRKAGIIRVVESCSAMDPAGVGLCIEQLRADDPARDDAIDAYVEWVHVWHPEMAARLAIKAADTALRERLVEKALQVWLKVDPTSARRWIANAELPEQAKQRLSALEPESDF